MPNIGIEYLHIALNRGGGKLPCKKDGGALRVLSLKRPTAEPLTVPFREEIFANQLYE